MRKRTTEVAGVSREMKLLLSVEEAAAVLSVGRSLVYALVLAKQLHSVKLGSTRRIPVRALHEFVERLIETQTGA
jgi:excisionase family DNA binding protein